MPARPLSLAVPPIRPWALAVAAGLAATLILYDARLGVNVALWTALAAGGLFVMRPRGDGAARHLRLPLGFALVLAIGTAVTADGDTLFLAVLLIASLLGLATLLAALAPTRAAYGAPFIVGAPFRALLMSVGSSVEVIVATVSSIGALRRSPALRGALLATPVALVFASLFADADPLFARGRDAVTDVLTSIEMLPRLGFFLAVTFVVLGAYAYAASTHARSAAATGEHAHDAVAPRSHFRGVVEHTIVIASAAVVSWLFVALQIAYLVSNAPARAGSGVTFAEYAHRGFGQLSVLATIAVLLVVMAIGRPDEPPAPRRLRLWVFALLAAVAGVLASAFHRVTLYENVYGFTTARVDAQAYMLVVLAILVLSAIETARGFDAARLARATMTVALAAMCVITFWNDHAWVVRADVARFAGTKRLDTGYLAHRLSPDAYPALLDALPALPPMQREQLASELWPAAACELRGGNRWFEWNASRSTARAALRAHGFSLTPPPNAPCVRGGD